MKKLLLLVFSMTLVLFFTSNAFAQKGVVKVASNQELIKALDDPTVETIEITQAGFYDEILLDAPGGTILEKGKDGDRNVDCIYWIQPMDVCFDPDNQPAGVTPGFVVDTAKAGAIGGAGICPADSSGVWTVIFQTDPTATVNFLAADSCYILPFEVDKPGQYQLRYDWVDYSTYVSTDYYFYSIPEITELEADPNPVCGLTTDITWDWNLGFASPSTTVTWDVFYDGQHHDAAFPMTPGTFPFTVTECGAYDITLSLENSLGCGGADSTITIYFYDTPVVDAGMNDEVCGLTYTLSPSYTIECDNGLAAVEEWSMVSGPTSGTAMFAGNVVTVDSCGLYEFQYKVTNDLCADSATVEIMFFDDPVITMMPDDTVCGLTADIMATNTVKCTNGVEVKWTKCDGPGIVSFLPDDEDASVVTVDTCGLYTFCYTVTNGPCESTGSVDVFFAGEPVIEFDPAYPVPEKVCGFETDEFFVDYSTTCDANSSAEWTTNADSIVETSPSMFTAYVDTCGTYWFTYTVTNGPCVEDTTLFIEFYETPEPEIIGDTLVYACSTVEYCVTDLGSCNPLDSLEFSWEVAGGAFEGGVITPTTECVNVEWDNQFNVWGQVIVHVNIKGLPECSASDTLDVWRMQPTLEGQVKYWNAVETYMPTPYATDDYNTIPFDYFYVTLYVVDINHPDGLSAVETVYVQPRLMEDLNELMSYFDFELNTMEYGCEAEYVLKVWDGGMVYHTTPPAPFEETKLGGSTYTYNNWGGVNATDALAIQLMVNGATDLQALGYNWVGMQGYMPQYGYYSHGIADVNSTNTYTDGGITALDALTAKYRAVGLLGSYPMNDDPDVNQFTPNFRVTGRMVPELPFITFPTPFDYPNVDDVPFTHSGTDYMYFSLAVDHKYTSVPIPWEGDANYINLYYESIGDINASYIPPGSGLKAEPSVELTYEGMFGAYVGEELTIPVTVDRDAEVGAITLSFNYRNDLIEVLGTNYSDDDMFFNQEEGILNMAWFSTEARELIADATVAQIRVRILEEIPEGTELFSLNVNTELADATANPIDVDLKTIGVSTDKGIDVTALTASNYPNPFNDATTISYVLPESGSVKVDVYNNMGMLVATLVDEAQDSGVQNVVFNSGAAQAGVYFYHITVQGETNNYSAVKRMIVVN